VEDNGEPSDPVPDRGIATALPLEARFLIGCPAVVPSAVIAHLLTAPALPLISGNVTVHDGTP
jgi:hypothetical protein